MSKIGAGVAIRVNATLETLFQNMKERKAKEDSAGRIHQDRNDSFDSDAPWGNDEPSVTVIMEPSVEPSVTFSMEPSMEPPAVLYDMIDVANVMVEANGKKLYPPAVKTLLIGFMKGMASGEDKKAVEELRAALLDQYSYHVLIEIGAGLGLDTMTCTEDPDAIVTYMRSGKLHTRRLVTPSQRTLAATEVAIGFSEFYQKYYKDQYYKDQYKRMEMLSALECGAICDELVTLDEVVVCAERFVDLDKKDVAAFRRTVAVKQQMLKHVDAGNAEGFMQNAPTFSSAKKALYSLATLSFATHLAKVFNVRCAGKATKEAVWTALLRAIE